MSACPTCGLPSAFANPEHVADGHHRASQGVPPDDGRRHNLLVALTPSLLTRIEALGFEAGSGGVLPWLVGKAEEMRAECDAFATYREMTTTALGIEPSSCAEDVADAVNEMLRPTLAAEQGRAEGAPSEGWTYDGEWRRNDGTADRFVARTDDSDPNRRWCATVMTGPEDAAIERELWAPTARAAMIAADKALETP